MSSQYPLVGYKFCIIQGDVIAVTGDILHGHGAGSYLVRFNTGAPYNRVVQADAPLFADMNLFETEDELGNFIQVFHKIHEPSAANDVIAPDDGALEPEDIDNPAVA